MAEVNLTQAEADALLAMEKRSERDEPYRFPGMGQRISVPLMSFDGREEFLLDVTRGRIELRKITYQHRARQIVILARLDMFGRPHRNPDGQEVPAPHLHVYCEGFGDKWAVPVPSGQFHSLSDEGTTLDDFMRYCNITQAPNILRLPIV